MNPIILIPARYASTRFPGKPLAMIHGKSMIMRVVEQALHVCPDVYVATDDERIYNHVIENKAQAVYTDSNHQSGTDRCNEAYIKISVQQKKNWDVVVNLQGDEPFINPEQIKQVINIFNNKSVEIGTQARKFSENSEINDPNKVKVLFDKNNKALYFSRSVIPYKRDENISVDYFQHVGLYAFTPQALKNITQLPMCEIENIEKLEQLRWLYNGYSIHVCETEFNNLSVDTPDDLQKIIERNI